MPPIPPREPIADTLHARIERHDEQTLLIADADAPARLIRYGIRYLGKPHWSVVPGLIALEYGDILTGEAAWDFLLHRSNRYPRAEVFGYRSDGRDEMLYVKQLDLALPIEPLVFDDADAPAASARPVALIADDHHPLPDRLLRHLPRYASIAAWRASQLTDIDPNPGDPA